ncbi:DUF2809 domain-containing protein [Hyella patelloides]|uniref:ribosomal maturation YjgA family protein n=1 Tax=Hyella patelloides TaxID=1982969 RepID=UPI001FECBDB4|nr:DUF2809 domain-containing protein [Hyella patelloides]
MLVIVPLGLLSKAYTGIGQSWVNDYSGDILYEILWCLVFFWFFPSKKAVVTIPIWVFIVTSIIEVSQLFFDRVPVTLRETIIWKLLLGSAFVWWDFPHYALGSFLGWLLLDRIYQLTVLRPQKDER